MSAMPSDFDRIVETCILMEIQAMNLYTTLAGRSEDPEAQRILRFLAESEEGHVGRLVEIFSEFGRSAEKALSMVDVVKAFQSEAWTQYKARLAGAGLTETSPADDYLTFAIVAEAHARSHYARLADEADDPRLKGIFGTLASEEAGHEENLKRIRGALRG